MGVGGQGRSPTGVWGVGRGRGRTRAHDHGDRLKGDDDLIRLPPAIQPVQSNTQSHAPFPLPPPQPPPPHTHTAALLRTSRAALILDRRGVGQQGWPLLFKKEGQQQDGEQTPEEQQQLSPASRSGRGSSERVLKGGFGGADLSILVLARWFTFQHVCTCMYVLYLLKKQAAHRGRALRLQDAPAERGGRVGDGGGASGAHYYYYYCVWL